MKCPNTGYTVPDSSIYCLACASIHPRVTENGISEPEKSLEESRRRKPTRSRNKNGRWRKKRSDAGKPRRKKQ